MRTPNLMNEVAAAEYLGGLALGTLRYWRYTGKGPKFVKQGKRVFYDETDLDSFLDSNRFQSTSEVKQAS